MSTLNPEIPTLSADEVIAAVEQIYSQVDPTEAAAALGGMARVIGRNAEVIAQYPDVEGRDAMVSDISQTATWVESAAIHAA